MKRTIALLLALSMLFALAACGGGDTTTEAPQTEAPATEAPADDGGQQAEEPPVSSDGPKYGGTATVYYPKFYNFFDPIMMDQYQFSFWYETLWTIDWSQQDDWVGETPLDKCTGQLAKSWDFDETAGTLTVQLRDDVLFQEGEPYNGRAFVADDVVWSYGRALGIGGYEKFEYEMDWGTYLPFLTDVKADGEHTVVFSFGDGQANSVSLTKLFNTRINIGGPEWDSCPQTWEYAKGTGPYVLTAYVPDNSMTFTKNENYYGYDERYPENKLPYIDTIELVYIADSSNILAQAMAGSLDWFGENGKDVLSGAEIEQLKSANVGQTIPFMSSSPSALGLKVNQKPFDDINVRIAMQKAIDIEAIDSQYLGNTGEIFIPGLFGPALGDWSTAGTWPDSLMDEFKYDPEASKTLLAEAGYPDGFEFEVLTDPLVDMDLFTLVADYLAEVGIKMNINAAAEMMEAVQVSQDQEDPRMFNGFAGGFPEYMLALMMTGRGPMPNANAHTDEWYLDELDKLGAVTSTEEQVAIARELDEYYPAQHWNIYLSGMQPSYDYMSNRIGGYNGEKVYYNDNMRTIWARLWIEG